MAREYVVSIESVDVSVVVGVVRVNFEATGKGMGRERTEGRELSEETMIRVVRLDCWHANELIYQAEGETDDGRFVYVRYRRPWFSVGLGATPDDAAGDDTFGTDAHPDHDPSAITRATLEAWCGDRFAWPERIDGFGNETPPPG